MASCILLLCLFPCESVPSTPPIKVASMWSSQIGCRCTTCHAFSCVFSKCIVAAVQADLKVARAQHAASDAAQRSDEEASKLRRELDFMKKEKKGLVQRCTSAHRELASSNVSCLETTDGSNTCCTCISMTMTLEVVAQLVPPRASLHPGVHALELCSLGWIIFHWPHNQAVALCLP